MSEEKQPIHGATQIADIMSNVLRPVSSPDSEMLTVVAEFSLQLTAYQQMTINRLQMLVFDSRVPEDQKQMIEAFVPQYQRLKRYHDSMAYINRTIEAMSLRKFWNDQSMKGQVLKNQ